MTFNPHHEAIKSRQLQAAEGLGKSVLFCDALSSGGTGPEMVIIPAGSFMMGSPVDEPERTVAEGPLHRVDFACPFAMGRHAVRFLDFDRFSEACGREKPFDNGFGRGDRPVIHVSFEDALAYCDWLNLETGGGYRLPSEAEWEYACRGESTSVFWWGDAISPDLANYRGEFAYNKGITGEFRQKTLPVGEFSPNPLGLFQMHGNVWEWCLDSWHDDYVGAPGDGGVWLDAGVDAHVVRGGSWRCKPVGLRAAYRASLPALARNILLGFRLVKDVHPG